MILANLKLSELWGISCVYRSWPYLSPWSWLEIIISLWLFDIISYICTFLFWSSVLAVHTNTSEAHELSASEQTSETECMKCPFSVSKRIRFWWVIWMVHRSSDSSMHFESQIYSPKLKMDVVDGWMECGYWTKKGYDIRYMDPGV